MDCPNNIKHRCSFVHLVFLKHKDGISRTHELFYCSNCRKYYISTHLLEDGAILGLGKKTIITNIHTNAMKNYINMNGKQYSKSEYENAIKKAPKIKSTFYVVENIFKCMNHGHELEEVDAKIMVLSRKKLTVEPVLVCAGYCRNCKKYHIARSVYEDKVLRKGRPLCEMIDYSNHKYNTQHVGNMELKDQSILMEYGYNVGQIDDLSEIQRRKILASLVDHHIVTRNGIISYLNFFIKSRQDYSKYFNAISKWESDMRFISEYNLGDYKKFGVYALK